MKHRLTLFISAALVVIFSIMFTANIVYGSDYGLGKTADVAGLKESNSGVPEDVPDIVGNVAGAILSLVAIVFFGLMIYGGIRWMLARGDEAEAKKALETIIAAIIGIIIVLAAYAITDFVFESIKRKEGLPDTPKVELSCVVENPSDTMGEIDLYCGKQDNDSEECAKLTISGFNVCDYGGDINEDKKTDCRYKEIFNLSNLCAGLIDCSQLKINEDVICTANQ